MTVVTTMTEVDTATEVVIEVVTVTVEDIKTKVAIKITEVVTQMIDLTAVVVTAVEAIMIVVATVIVVATRDGVDTMTEVEGITVTMETGTIKVVHPRGLQGRHIWQDILFFQPNRSIVF